MSEDRPMEVVQNVNEVEQRRLWKALDAIQNKLDSFEDKFSDIVRIAERMESHRETLYRFGKLLDNHEERIRDTEMKQLKDEALDRLIKQLSVELNKLKEEVDDLKGVSIGFKGNKAIIVPIFKWLSGIIAVLATAYLLGK